MKNIPVVRCQLVKESGLSTAEPSINTPDKAAAIFQRYLEGADREHFVILMLNVKNKPLGLNTVSIGTLNSSLVHPREVFKPAILASAASIIVAHNHPSGDTTPSREDIDLSKRLVQAGELLGIQVIDHLVVSDNRYCSFKESGYMQG